MFIHERDPLAPRGGSETPADVALNRRKWLRAAGAIAGVGVLGAGGYAGWRVYRGSDEEVISRGAVAPVAAGDSAANVSSPEGSAATEPVGTATAAIPRDERFTYGRAETVRSDAARYTNFYEFSSFKDSWRHVDLFQPLPWTVDVGGLCRNPHRMDWADFERQYRSELVERQYRHRCVETWAMAVPWLGVPLARLIAAADPLPTATHVRFVSFHRPDEAPGQRNDEFPWPYVEGLTLGEATNELTLLASGMYGEPLLKQHGAPVRLVVPWKYGFKSIKSVERIEFVDREPATFWTTLMPDAYPFESNVEPDVPRPWPQHAERMLGTGEVHPTQLYNGYGAYVADLYRR